MLFRSWIIAFQVPMSDQGIARVAFVRSKDGMAAEYGAAVVMVRTAFGYDQIIPVFYMIQMRSFGSHGIIQSSVLQKSDSFTNECSCRKIQALKPDMTAFTFRAQGLCILFPCDHRS